MSKPKNQLDPAAMPIADAVRILSASGSKEVTAESIQIDLGNGAPTNPDGTVNLVQYVAWLVKEMGQRAD